MPYVVFLQSSVGQLMQESYAEFCRRNSGGEGGRNRSGSFDGTAGQQV